MSVRCVALDKDLVIKIQCCSLSGIDKKRISSMTTHQLKRSFQLLLFIFLTLCLHGTLAASLNLVPAPSTLNASHNHPHDYHCNSLPSWTGGGPGSSAYKIQDCNQAIRMFEQVVARSPGKAQWLSLGFPHPVPGYGTPVWTPKRYVSGKLLMFRSISPSCDYTS